MRDLKGWKTMRRRRRARERIRKMATVTVKALQLHTYDGKEYKVGDIYEIDELYADSVKVQGKAERVEKKEPSKEYQTRDMKAQK
jgi:hypothetical protein